MKSKCGNAESKKKGSPLKTAKEVEELVKMTIKNLILLVTLIKLIKSL